MPDKLPEFQRSHVGPCAICGDRFVDSGVQITGSAEFVAESLVRLGMSVGRAVVSVARLRPDATIVVIVRLCDHCAAKAHAPKPQLLINGATIPTLQPTTEDQRDDQHAPQRRIGRIMQAPAAMSGGDVDHG